MNALSRIRQAYDGMPHRRRQYLNLGAVVGAGVGALWLVFSFGSSQPATGQAQKSAKAGPTNLGIQVGGEIDPREAWLGTAGRDVAQLKADVETQQRKDGERKATEDALTKRLAELEQRADADSAQRATAPPAPSPAPSPAPLPATPPARQAPAPMTGNNGPAVFPPATPLTVTGTPILPGGPAAGKAFSAPGAAEPEAPIVRISLVGAPGKGETHTGGAADTPANQDHADKENTVASFLPVSFTSGVLLGGIDAPTGGQAQSNPLPILVRLTDNAVLPNRYRSDVKECFVVAAGYGDISSERVYARTVNLSCVRHNGTTIEMPIQGNLYGEDGKLGLRGRLVTKQGQILANALRAGIVGGIGQGFAQGGTSYTSSPFGTLATNSGGTGEQIRRGMAGGVGHALDNLANYYIRLAEQTFPVVEVDAGRLAEVAITKGTSMPAASGHAEPPSQDEARDEDD